MLIMSSFLPIPSPIVLILLKFLKKRKNLLQLTSSHNPIYLFSKKFSLSYPHLNILHSSLNHCRRKFLLQKISMIETSCRRSLSVAWHLIHFFCFFSYSHFQPLYTSESHSHVNTRFRWWTRKGWIDAGGRWLEVVRYSEIVRLWGYDVLRTHRGWESLQSANAQRPDALYLASPRSLLEKPSPRRLLQPPLFSSFLTSAAYQLAP